jgi:uncharacterized protein (UPF0332 family)
MIMSQEFKKCIQRGKIKKFSPGPRLAGKELKLAEEDLKTAVKSAKEKNFRWSIIQSYYSMFHSARALIYSKEYREKSHFCLIESVKTLFVESGQIEAGLVESLLEAKNLREEADYYGDFSEINCQKLTKKACEFLKKAKEIIA